MEARALGTVPNFLRGTAAAACSSDFGRQILELANGKSYQNQNIGGKVKQLFRLDNGTLFFLTNFLNCAYIPPRRANFTFRENKCGGECISKCVVFY